MIKKLTAKVQQLNSQNTLDSRAFSVCIVIEAESKEISLKKGSIYGVFSISSTQEFDQNLVKNIVHDVLRESYFQTESISPIQSVEKSIVDVKDKITNLIVKNPDHKLDFNILASVLWGNVLYVVKFGEGESYLVRQGEIREIKTMSEGSFSAASGVIKDDDVVIIGTKDFCQTYPPHKLLSMAISEQALQPLESGMLLKFLVDTDFTQDEIVDFGITDVAKKSKVPEIKEKVSKKLIPFISGVGAGLSNVFKKIKDSKKQPQNQTTSIRLKSAKKLSFSPKIFIPVALTALLISIFITLKNNQNKKDTPVENDQESTVNQAAPVQPDQPEETPQPQEPDEPAEEIFYDIRLTNLEANPSEITVFPSYVVVVDKNTGSIFRSLREEPKFEQIDGTYVDINSITNSGNGELFFSDSEGFKFLDIVDNQIVNSYTQQAGQHSATYLGFLYTIKDGSIVKYTVSGDSVEEETWSTSEDFDNAKAITIAFDIFVLTGDDRLTSYTSGTKNSFEVTGLETPLSNAVEIVTDVDFDHIYVTDRGNKRIVKFDKEGAFVSEYKSQTNKEWDDLKNIGVSPDEATLYVLNGTRIYEIQLE